MSRAARLPRGIAHAAMRAVRSLGRRARAFRPRVSTAATIDFESPDVARDPVPHYEALRGAGSVQFLPRHAAWIVLGYDEVQFAFSRPDLFSNRPYADVDAVLLAADPPQHTAMRRVVARYFSAETVERLGNVATQTAAQLLKPRLDVVGDYGVPLSEAVGAALSGFDDDAVNDIRAARRAVPELASYIAALDTIAPRSTMYGRLREDGIADAPARSLIRLLWLAAAMTTERVIVRCILRLLENGELRRQLQDDSALVAPFVEEVLRLYPPEHMVPRVATAPVVLGGVTVPAGALVHLCVSAAHRDPLKFDEPHEIRLTRRSVRHFTFGSGIHHCVGATVGRRTINIAVQTLLARAPHFRAGERLDRIPYFSTMTANAAERLLIDTNIDRVTR